MSYNFPIFARMKKSYADLDVGDRYVVFKRRIKNDACDSAIRERLSTIDRSMFQFSSSNVEFNRTFSNIIREAYGHTCPITEVRKKNVDLIKPYIKHNIKKYNKEETQSSTLYMILSV